MSQPWMPLYVADYLADTRRLTTLEHGAYMLLIMEYWRNGGLPKDDQTLARIVGLTLEDWLCVRIAVAMLFTHEWTHKRIDHELARAREKSAKARSSANNRWKNKVNLDNAKAMRSDCVRNANGMLSQPQPYRGSPIERITRKIGEYQDEDDAFALRSHSDGIDDDQEEF